MEKLFIVFLLMTQSNFELEHLIDQNINTIKFGVVNSTGSPANENAKIFGVTNFKIDYFGKTIETMAVLTDSSNIIRAINFSLPVKLNDEFYNQLVDELGNATHIYKKGPVKEEDSIEYHNGTYVVSGSGQLVECSFDDNPYLIVWNRPNCQLRFVLNPYSNSTQVTFYKNELNK